MQTNLAHDELFDYAPILLKMDKMCQELHDLCLHKKVDNVPKMTNEMIVAARQLRAWATNESDKAGNW
jgi:hypothetical protein